MKQDSKQEDSLEKSIDILAEMTRKDTERLDERDKALPGWMEDLQAFRQMKSWKNNVTKALWVLYAAVIGWIAKNLFW